MSYPFPQAGTVGFDLQSVYGATFERENSSLFCSSDTSFRFLTDTVARVGTNKDFCDAEERAVFEFDLSSLTGGEPILMARLRLSQPLDSNLDIHGFAGDGVIGVGDANDANIIASGNGADLIDVTGLIQSLLGGGANFAGFMLDDPSILTDGPASGGSLRTFSTNASLEILFVPDSVPEPGVVVLLLAGLLGWGTTRRSRCAPAADVNATVSGAVRLG